MIALMSSPIQVLYHLLSLIAFIYKANEFIPLLFTNRALKCVQTCTHRGILSFMSRVLIHLQLIVTHTHPNYSHITILQTLINHLCAPGHSDSLIVCTVTRFIKRSAPRRRQEIGVYSATQY